MNALGARPSRPKDVETASKIQSRSVAPRYKLEWDCDPVDSRCTREIRKRGSWKGNDGMTKSGSGRAGGCFWEGTKVGCSVPTSTLRLQATPVICSRNQIGS
jgi:hypothetical protein